MSAGSDSESSASQSPISLAISESLKNRGKAAKKKGDNEMPIQEDALKPFLAAARWIPLAVDPFLSLLDIFLVGMKGRSGPGQREVMKKDDQYKCIVFELIVPLVPKFINVLSDYHKDPQAFQKFVKEISKPHDNVCSNDANAFKTALPQYLPPDDKTKHLFVIPDISNKHAWGWNNKITARFLCPMRLIHKFDEDPETFCEKVQSGAKVIKASDYPMFLYDEKKYIQGDMYSGLFQGPLLLRFYRHVFTGPRSWEKGKSAGGKLPRGLLNKLKAPTPRTIAYAAIMTRWALSSATKWELDDKGFNLVKFYHNIIVTFNEYIDWDCNYELDRKTEMWIKDTLRWWRDSVPGLQRGVATIGACSEDSDGEESDLSKCWGPVVSPITNPYSPLVSSVYHLLMLLPRTAAPGDESGTSAGSLNQATLDSTAAAAAQDFHSHASSGAQAQASTTEDFGPHASPGAQTQASTSAQTQAPVATAAQAEAPPTNKRPKERTAAPPDPGFDHMIDGELTPHASPAPKRSKQGATKGADKPKPIPASGPKPGIRKSTRKKH
ncbi:hypothetical protein M378DRAFT_28132 [Amanita muscaria Koide BX008]|uniref:Uncharacterized protein n=1 Tax=Amanita muscaria (strain Koide BX008) TaxID=946122 RepID=A0A0C2W7C4_AMAMK|nr:hypothetical protein M378DRAFT_28132 [Amanita muscaria Koide BX008]